MENFKVLPFKSINLERGKSSRKRRDLELINGDFFPAEGHTCLEVNRTRAFDADEDDHIDTVSCIYFGGARRSDESSWGDSKDIFQVDYCVTNSDVYISDILKFEPTGSTFPALQSAAAVVDTQKIYVWGGYNTAQLTVDSDLLILTKGGSKFNCEIVQQEAISLLARPVSKSKQSGFMPEGRAGHTLTNIGNHAAVLHGGVTMPMRKTSTLNSPFLKACKDGKFYELNLQTYKWSQINVPEVTPRAFHSAEYSVDHKSIYIVGGITYTGYQPDQRLPIDDVIVVKILDDNTYSLDRVVFTFATDLPKYLSYHSSCLLENQMFVFGGFYQKESKMEDVPQLNSNILTYNLTDLTLNFVELDKMHRSAGNTSVTLSNDCIMVVGGSTKNYFVYTSKPMVPSPCDYASECNICDSPEISPISWVQCEGSCHRWLHQFCVGVLTTGLPKGKFICKDCKGKGKKRGHSSSRKATSSKK